jgi:hypothetical protein
LGIAGYSTIFNDACPRSSPASRLEGKIEAEESKETNSKDNVFMFMMLVEQQYENFKTDM